MKVELSDSEIRVVCAALAYLRDAYSDMAEMASLPEGRPLVEMEADYTSSADSLQALIDRLTPSFKP